MQLDLRHITATHKHFEGELPPEIWEMEGDKFARPTSGLRYSLDVEVLGKELLVRGNLEADFELQCARCGEFYSTNRRASAFVRSFEISEGQEFLDLTPDLREEIVLELPVYPGCAEADPESCPRLARIRALQADFQEPGDDDHRWDALDGFKID